MPGGASSGARAIVRLRIAILVSGRGFGYQSSTPLVPPRITYPKQFNFWDRMYHSPTHVSTSSRDDVGYLILSVNGPTKIYPRGSNQYRLSANREHVFVLYPSQEASSDPSTYHECVRFEGGESAFEDLGDMLERIPDDATSFGQEASEEVG